MSDKTPEAAAQATNVSDMTVIKPTEALTNGGEKPIDNVVPNQSSTSMSPAPAQNGGSCMFKRGGSCMVHRGGNCMLKQGGRRSAKKQGRKSNKKQARKSQKKRGGKSHKKNHK
jgi:hypothetical protein